VRLRAIGAGMLFIYCLCACSPAPPASGGTLTSAVSEDEARAMAEEILTALNEGDYAAWSANWSQELKDAINEEAFLAFRDEALAQRGDFQDITDVTLEEGSEEGFVRWVLTAEHEDGPATLALGFETDGREITGIFWEPVD
jgi:hypothetical protein